MKDRKSQKRGLAEVSHFFLSGPELNTSKEKVTIRMAAKALGVSKGTVITYLNEGSLTRINEGGQIYLSRDEVKALNLKLSSKSSVTTSPQTNITATVPIRKQQSNYTSNESDSKSTVAIEKDLSGLHSTRVGLLENERQHLFDCGEALKAKDKKLDILTLEVNKLKQNMETQASELRRTKTRLRELEREQQKLLANNNKTTDLDEQQREETRLKLLAMEEKLKRLSQTRWQKLFDRMTPPPECSVKKGMVVFSTFALLAVLIYSLLRVSVYQKQPLSSVTEGRISGSETVQLTSEALLAKDLPQEQSSRVARQPSEPLQTRVETDPEPAGLNAQTPQQYFANVDASPSLEKRVSLLSEANQQVAELASAAPPYVLRAEILATTWLHLVIDEGQALEYLLYPNEKHTWRAMSGFKLHIGNAAGLQLYLNDQPLKALGESGKVVHLQLPDPSLIVTSN